MPTFVRRAVPIVVALFALACSACSAAPYVSARPMTPPPPSDALVVRETAFFSGVRALRLFEQSWRPRRAPRAAVLIVHGLKDHSSRYDAFARRLVAEGFAVHAFDLRGHGRSEGVRVAIDDFSEYLDDLSVELTRVRAREPGVPVFLMGHSMGGAIVTLFALERRPAIETRVGKPPSIAGIVLSAAALAIDASAVKVAGTKAIAAISPDAGVFQLDLADFSRDPAVVADNRSDPFVYPDPAPARTAALLIDAIDTIGERAGELDVPLLAMHGDADRITPPEGSRELVRRARTRDKTLKIYPGLVHDLLHEPERDIVARDVAQWLEARAGGR